MAPTPLFRSKKWDVFAVTYFSYAVVYITRKLFSVVKTLIQDDLRLSTCVLGTIDSVFLGTYAIFQVFLPSLSDAFGVRPVLLFSLWAAAFFSLTFAVSYSPRALIYSWLFEGIAHAPIFAVLVKSVSLWFRPCERGKILGIWTTSQQIGAMLATTLATFVSTTFGWRAAFMTAAVVTAGAAVVVYWALPEPLPQTIADFTTQPGIELPIVTKRRKTAVASAVDGSPPDIVESRVKTNDNEDGSVATGHASVNFTHHCSTNSTASSGAEPVKIGASSSPNSPIESPLESAPNIQPMRFMEVLSIPNLVACGIAYFCVKLVRYALLFWLPYFLITELGFGTSLAGYSSMLFDVGGVFGAVASGFVADRLFKGKRLTTAAAMCVATSLSLLLFAHSAATCSYGPSTSSVRSSSLPNSYVNSSTLSVNFSDVRSIDSGQAPVTSFNFSKINRPDVNIPSSISFDQSTESSRVRTESFLSGQLVVSPAVKLRFLRRRQPSEANHFLVDVSASYIPKNFDRPTNFPLALILMTLVGFFIAGPDSILGAASAGEICERSGKPSAQLVLSTATGIVNGLGAFGGVAQGYLTAVISETWGWPALFLVLCVASLGSVAALWSCIHVRTVNF